MLTSLLIQKLLHNNVVTDLGELTRVASHPL